jgi:hypothetical protein
VHLIPLALALGPNLAGLVEEADASQPFFRGEVDFTGEIVDVSHQTREDLSHAGAGVGAARVDDVLGEVGVILAARHGEAGGVFEVGRAVGSHGVGSGWAVVRRCRDWTGGSLVSGRGVSSTAVWEICRKKRELSGRRRRTRGEQQEVEDGLI